MEYDSTDHLDGFKIDASCCLLIAWKMAVMGTSGFFSNFRKCPAISKLLIYKYVIIFL